jgi:peroxiredoxin
VEIWAVSPDSLDKLAKYADQSGIEFTLMSDGDLAVIGEWGIVNPDRPTVPHPTAVIIDSEGVIRYYRQDINYKKRPAASELLEVIDSLD